MAMPECEVRSVTVIPNQMESIRKPIKELGHWESLRPFYEAEPCDCVLHGQLPSWESAARW